MTPVIDAIENSRADDASDEGSESRGKSGTVTAWLLVALSLSGIAISVYLTTLHYAGVAPVCSNNGEVDCSAVTKSRFSIMANYWPFSRAGESIRNIPITVPGMFWFAVTGALAVLAVIAIRRGRQPAEWLTNVLLGWTVIGVLTVLYLVRAELAVLHKICEWCTGVHLLVFASFVVALIQWQRMMAARYRVE